MDEASSESGAMDCSQLYMILGVNAMVDWSRRLLVEGHVALTHDMTECSDDESQDCALEVLAKQVVCCLSESFHLTVT